MRVERIVSPEGCLHLSFRPQQVCRNLCNEALPPLPEDGEPLAELPAFAVDNNWSALDDLPPPSFKLHETQAHSQTQAHATQALSEASLSVLSALQTMRDAKLAAEEFGGSEEELALSVHVCTTGLAREEAAKIFYQLLGTLPLSSRHFPRVPEMHALCFSAALLLFSISVGWPSLAPACFAAFRPLPPSAAWTARQC